jgi:hypothetical protein
VFAGLMYAIMAAPALAIVVVKRWKVEVRHRVVSLNYRSIPEKRVYPIYSMNILRDPSAFDFQWFIPTTRHC